MFLRITFQYRHQKPDCITAIHTASLIVLTEHKHIRSVAVLMEYTKTHRKFDNINGIQTHWRFDYITGVQRNWTSDLHSSNTSTLEVLFARASVVCSDYWLCGWSVDDLWMTCGWYVDDMWMTKDIILLASTLHLVVWGHCVTFFALCWFVSVPQLKPCTSSNVGWDGNVRNRVLTTVHILSYIQVRNIHNIKHELLCLL